MTKSEASKSVREKKARFVRDPGRGRCDQKISDPQGSDGWCVDSDATIAEIEFKKDELASLVARRNAELEKEERISQPIPGNL